MFDNVTYTFYSNTLGRAVVPSAADFDALKMTNILEFKKLLPYIEELEENGIDSAVCMCIEKEYINNTSGNDAAVSSESLSGHSISYDMTIKSKMAKTLDAQKMDVIKLFCNVNIGVL